MKLTWPKCIGRRLALGFGVLVLLLLTALLQSAHQMYLASQVAERFATQDMQRLLRVQALLLQIEGLRVSFIRLLHAPRENRVAEYADVDAQNRRIDGNIASLGADQNDAQLQDILRRLIACRTLYADAFIATADEIEAGNPVAAAQALNDQVNPALKAMLLESNALLTHERQKVEKRLTDAQSMLYRIAWSMLGMSALLAAIRLEKVVACVKPLALTGRGHPYSQA